MVRCDVCGIWYEEELNYLEDEALRICEWCLDELESSNTHHLE